MLQEQSMSTIISPVMVYHLSPHRHSSNDAGSASTVEWISEKFQTVME